MLKLIFGLPASDEDTTFAGVNDKRPTNRPKMNRILKYFCRLKIVRMVIAPGILTN
jgi:hypothetical protein